MNSTEREQKGQMSFVKQMSEKRDGKGERIKTMRSITWQRFANENIGRKIEEVDRVHSGQFLGICSNLRQP